MRTFIAIELDESIKAELQRAQGFFEDLHGKVQWTKPAQMHLTIKFLGEVPEDRIDRLKEVLCENAAKVESFEFRVEGLGSFPPAGRQLKILWAGVNAPGQLSQLNDLFQQACTEFDCPPEQRRFSPHLTLGRIKDVRNPQAYRQIIIDRGKFSAGLQQVNSITLFRSDLRSEGAVYTRLETAKLGHDPG